MGKWFWGIVILAIISLLVGHFLHGGAGVNSSAMGDSVRDALKNEHSWAKVDIDGNVAKLSGEAPSKSAADSAVLLAKKAISGTAVSDKGCGKCKSAKGFSVANNATIKAAAVQPKAPAIEVVSPYRFKATKLENGRVDLTGFVPTEDDRVRVYNEAEALFGNKLRTKKVGIAAGAPDANWDDVISAHLPELASLDYGTFTLNDRQALVQGFVGDTSVRDRVNAVVTALPEGYVGAANITVPNAAAQNAGEVKDASLCQGLFNQLKGDSRINFASGKAEIRGAQSFDLLNTLASAANQCKTFRIQIEGHTDNEGDAGYNQTLSERRANSVQAYLADNGVEIGRMSAIGFGENNPIATNETPEGKAANRRINFVVTQSE